MREEQKPADVAVPDVEMRAQAAPRIQRPYTLAEIKAKIASNDYSAELLLQHAMLLLEAQAAPQPPVAAQEPAAHDWRHSPSYGGEICASCGAAKGTRRGKAPCGEVSEKLSPIGYLYDWVSDDGVVRDWFSQDYDEAHSPTNQCHNIRPLYTHPAPHPAPVAQGDALTQAARDVLAEVERATGKFPTWPTDPLHALAVLGEEFGELTKDMLQLTYEPHKTSVENVRTEAMQTAAMALRLYMSLDRYIYQACEQHSQAKKGGA